MSKENGGINSSHSGEIQDRLGEEMGHDSIEKTRDQSAPVSRDKVVLTEMASKLKSLEHLLAEQPEVDQNHVNRVREAIKRGEYHVVPDRVAGKLMGFEEDF